MKTAAIIQARTGSERLPKKMLMTIADYKIIEWVIERVKLAKRLNEIILATTTKKQDDILEKIALEHNIKVFRGSETDLLKRYYDCAKENNIDIIVRICADNPLISFELIDWTIESHLNGNKEFTESLDTEITGWIDGFGCEISNFNLLEKLHLEYKPTIEEREHVFEYIWNRLDEFDVNHFKVFPEYKITPKVKLDIDYKEDYFFMKKFIEKNNIKFNSSINYILNKIDEIR